MTTTKISQDNHEIFREQKQNSVFCFSNGDSCFSNNDLFVLATAFLLKNGGILFLKKGVLETSSPAEWRKKNSFFGGKRAVFFWKKGGVVFVKKGWGFFV